MIGLLTNSENSLSLPVRPRDSGRSGASLKFLLRNSNTDFSRTSFQATAVASPPTPKRVEILVAAEADVVGDRVGFSEAALTCGSGSVKLKRGPTVASAKAEIEPGDAAVMVGKAGAADLDRVAVLGAEIDAVEDRPGPEDIHVRFLDELAVQQHVADRRMHQRRTRREIGVGLVLRPEEEVAAEPPRLAQPRDLGEIGLDARL